MQGAMHLIKNREVRRREHHGVLEKGSEWRGKGPRKSYEICCANRTSAASGGGTKRCNYLKQQSGK